MHGVADPAPEDGSESEEVQAELRKCSGKRSEEWKILEDIAGSREKAQEVLTDILQKQAETFGFTQHPYQRTKRMAGEGVLDHGELWHCKHMRKYGSTLTCPVRCTAQCGFKIKYQFKDCQLKVYTLGEHSHENEIRKRGLKLEKASKLLEAVEVVPTSK
jgi:hypothetical protein